MRTICSTLVLLLLTAAQAWAQDAKGKPSDAATRHAKEAAAKAAVEQFEKQFAAAHDEADKMDAMLSLAHVRDRLVVEEIGRIYLHNRDTEVRDAAAQLLGTMSYDPERAGKILKRGIRVNASLPGVLQSTFRAVGKLGYRGARREMEETTWHDLRRKGYSAVVVEAFRTFADLGDVRAIPFLLKVDEFHLTIEGVHNGRRIGSAGKSGIGRGAGMVLDRYWKQELDKAIQKLTGKSFHDAMDFRRWLKKHEREVDAGTFRPGGDAAAPGKREKRSKGEGSRSQ